MITKEQFEKIELAYGCGYWNVCDDHACPCHPTAAVSQGFNEEVYARMKKQNEEERCRLERELENYRKYSCAFCLLCALRREKKYGQSMDGVLGLMCWNYNRVFLRRVRIWDKR